MAKKEAKTKKENSKNKKSFFKDFKAELKKVSWPTPKQLVNNTVAVVTIVLITAVVVFALDLAFETLNKHGVEKIKEVIVNDNSTEENTTNDTAVENGNNTVESTIEGNTEASNEENNTENNAE